MLQNCPTFDLVARLGIDQLRIQEVREFGSPTETQRPSDESMSWAKRVCQARAAQYGTNLDWSAYREWASGICEWPWHKAYVRANGRISLCCEKFFTEADEDTFGNIHEQSAMNIWNGPKYRMARRKLANGSYPVTCRKCPIYGFPDVEIGEELDTHL